MHVVVEEDQWDHLSVLGVQQTIHGLNIAGNGIDVVAVADMPGRPEMFQIVRNSNDPSLVWIKVSNGFFLQVFVLSFIVILFLTTNVII